jgi:two-component system LytT family response regulator
VDRDQARVMCLRLAEILSDSLTLGAESRITLGREVALADQYLGVERVRFGSRLQVASDIAPEVTAVPVPPLIIQPLVENAVRHGVATLLDGGEVRISASGVGGSVLLVVTNPYDAEVRRRGTGFGMEIVRRRLAASFDRAALTSAATASTVRLRSHEPQDLQDPLNECSRVIVDDEEPARLALAQALSTLTDVSLVGECQNGFDAVRVVTELRPDAVLLDADAEADGFDVLELIGVTPVIFVTAYDEFAIKAFEVHAVDYLLKPVSPERLRTAIDRVRERGRPATPTPAAVRASARRPGEPLERVVIRDGAQVHVIAVDRIDYVEAQDDYVGFRTGGKLLLKEQTMAEVEASLDARRFVRIHRSYVRNVERLARVAGMPDYASILTDGTKLPVTRSGYQRSITL